MNEHLTVAGTFDHLHAGHTYLLDLAFAQAKKISIGIATDTLYKHKTLASVIEPLEQRKQQVEQYLNMSGYAERAVLFELSDVYGISLTDETLDAIYVTPDTVENAHKINKERGKKGMKPLEIYTALMMSGDDGEIISSSRIRQGIINRQGHSYLQHFQKKERFVATQLVRDELRVPIGDIVTGTDSDVTQAGNKVKTMLLEQKPLLVITVGDVVTHTLKEVGITPDIAVIDFMSRRQKFKPLVKGHTSVLRHGAFKNDAGSIESSFALHFAALIKECFTVSEKKGYHQIEIDGEEDVPGLAVMLLAPLESVVLYGHFEAGVMYVRITEEIKEYCENILLRFE